jgi:DnaK suppressor protein
MKNTLKNTLKDTLSEATVAELRTQLEREHELLHEQIAALRTAEGLDQPQNSLERRGEVTDQADQAMDQAEWDRMRIAELALTDRLTEVEHALEKFQTGLYGLCEKCSAPIPAARLRVLPEARFDIAHEAPPLSRVSMRRSSFQSDPSARQGQTAAFLGVWYNPIHWGQASAEATGRGRAPNVCRGRQWRQLTADGSLPQSHPPVRRLKRQRRQWVAAA